MQICVINQNFQPPNRCFYFIHHAFVCDVKNLANYVETFSPTFQVVMSTKQQTDEVSN